MFAKNLKWWNNQIINEDNKMVIRKGKHWLEICDENCYDPRICYQNEIDGFWVAFLYGVKKIDSIQIIDDDVVIYPGEL